MLVPPKYRTNSVFKKWKITFSDFFITISILAINILIIYINVIYGENIRIYDTPTFENFISGAACLISYYGPNYDP